MRRKSRKESKTSSNQPSTPQVCSWQLSNQKAAKEASEPEIASAGAELEPQVLAVAVPQEQCLEGVRPVAAAPQAVQQLGSPCLSLGKGQDFWVHTEVWPCNLEEGGKPAVTSIPFQSTTDLLKAEAGE